VKPADITTAVAKDPKSAIIMAIIATKASVIKVHPIVSVRRTASILLRAFKTDLTEPMNAEDG
jgi:hypothetical protein